MLAQQRHGLIMADHPQQTNAVGQPGLAHPPHDRGAQRALPDQGERGRRVTAGDDR